MPVRFMPVRSAKSLRPCALSLLTLCALVGFAVCCSRAVRAGGEKEADAEARKTFSDKVAGTYDYHFRPNAAFLPSLMTTDTGEFIDAKSFPTAQYCQHCHEASYHQWRESAHSNANRAPWYKRNVDLLGHEKGVEYTRHCEGCHNPVALVSGALTKGAPKDHKYDADGVTCTVCHSIQSADARGTGSYVLATPAVLVDESGAPIHRPVSDGEILAHLDRHSAAVMKPFYRSSEFCAVCHKAALPHELNDYKWQRAMSPYDEWQNASFAKQSPLPFYVKPTISTCQTCHMNREALEGRDPGAKKGMLASHRWLGANSLVPDYYKYPDQSAKIRAFLQSEVLNVDLFALERETAAAKPSGTEPEMIAPLGLTPFTITPGDKLTASVVIQNKGAAHSLVPEQRDMYESWVDFQVKDAGGRILAESGALQASRELDPSAHSFTNRLINKNGTLNDLHQVWNNRVVAYNNSIQSGRSQLIRYSFTVPPTNKGAISLTATVRYRRFDQHFIDFAAGKHYDQPIIDMATTTRVLQMGENTPPPPPVPASGVAAAPPMPGVNPTGNAVGNAAGNPTVNPTWMRWNNYGVALLDAQQYAASVNAFQHVATMRPEYADAQTNIAIAMIQWERYADAMPALSKALALAPNNARALYYRALVERNEGNLDQAIADLQKVESQYPRSRDAHRELGFSFYQQGKYDQARAEYEAVQGIDPDDLAAHYNLSILYRRLGSKDKAREQAAFFADQKDDPTASTFALEYLRKHHEIAQESIPWHVHNLDGHDVDATGALSADIVPSQSQP